MANVKNSRERYEAGLSIKFTEYEWTLESHEWPSNWYSPEDVIDVAQIDLSGISDSVWTNGEALICEWTEDEEGVERWSDLVLVKTVHSDAGYDDRAWAYVNANGLPEYFDNGSKVPQRFIKEFNRELRCSFAVIALCGCGGCCGRWHRYS